MARIEPLAESSAGNEILHAFKEHIESYQARITNMKATLGHSLISFQVYMQWYPLYREVERITGRRAAYLYAFAISTASDCPLCSTFFRKIIVDAGSDPANLELSADEKALLDFGSAIARNQGNIDDKVYNVLAEKYSTEELVVLIAFAGQMIATNIFNNVVQTDIDAYLTGYLPPEKFTGTHLKNTRHGGITENATDRSERGEENKSSENTL